MISVFWPLPVTRKLLRVQTACLMKSGMADYYRALSVVGSLHMECGMYMLYVLLLFYFNSVIVILV